MSSVFQTAAIERATLGALLARGRTEDFTLLDRDHFADERHGAVFEAIRLLIQRDGRVTLTTLEHELHGVGVPLVLLADIVEADGGHVPALARILRERRQRRALDALGVGLTRQARDETLPTPELLRWFERQCARLKGAVDA